MSQYDSSLFIHSTSKGIVLLLLYVDVPKASLAAVQEVYNTSRRDQFLMKLRPEFEVVRAKLKTVEMWESLMADYT
ncbi:hypothetical protein MTR_4g098730 [Medicago truncatula]|uniref:Uncharacterized protein n=1 Tax=Medicago truncatula TaxID=3880 RepID=G7JHL8_MEDTR|nr:hypothetical protein MTR_4g098730 [Medicago truncatula]